MSGTIVIRQGVTFDVRTIDFVRIVDLLRSSAAWPKTAAKLLETVDGFGMNMICADELDPAEFRDFDELMREACAALGDEEQGLVVFLGAVRSSIMKDRRISSQG